LRDGEFMYLGKVNMHDYLLLVNQRNNYLGPHYEVVVISWRDRVKKLRKAQTFKFQQLSDLINSFPEIQGIFAKNAS